VNVRPPSFPQPTTPTASTIIDWTQARVSMANSLCLEERETRAKH